MFISIKTKIWLTVLTIVLLFTFFTLFYFPAQQGQLLLKNYNNEVQDLANTVALGVKIGLDEQNYEGVQTAMEFVKGKPGLAFISLLQADTVWDSEHAQFDIKETVFKTFPETMHPDPNLLSNDSIIVKRSPFHTSLMSGNVLLGFSTKEIKESKKNIRLASLLVSGIIFLIGMFISFWLSRNISLPLLTLRKATKLVGDGYTPIVDINSRDEIGDLAQAFNKMVYDLSKAREELNQSNRTLSATNATLHDTLNDLKNTQAKLIHFEKMASLGELTAGIAHEIQNPLNFINNFSEVSLDLASEMEQELEKGNKEDVLSIITDIRQNLQKVVTHGKRADAIVKGMLQHSRKSIGQKEPTDINALIDEYVRLSYHGMRAKDKSFNVVLHTDFDPSVGKVNIIPQEIGRVILNILNNAFYSVIQKSRQTDKGYQPAVTVSTKKRNNKIRISIQDNGVGISETALGKIFQPFFTTKPAGEGTGLGLSLSYDIITKSHGGELNIETEEGAYANFIIELPI